MVNLLGLLSGSLPVNLIAGVAALVLLIIFLVKIYALKNEIVSSASKSALE